MEVSNNIQPKAVITGQYKNQNEHANNPSFGNIIVSTMDAIERGGFAAAFVVQDTMGMTTPRTITGLYRNSDITGEKNYQEALEVFIREFVSGSAMVLVPMAMIWGIKKKFGKANDVPVNMIQSLGKQFEKTVEKYGSAELKSEPENVKKMFYTDVFKNMLTNAYDSSTAHETITKKAESFAEKLIKAENAPKKSFFKKLRDIPVKDSADDILGELVSEFAEIRKSGSINASAYFTQAKITNGTSEVNRDFSKATNDLRNFTDDILESIKNKIDTDSFTGERVKDFIKRFTDFRAGGRVLVNASMLAGIIGFCSCIPKLYQLSDKNPGLNGLPNTQQNQTNQPTNEKNISFKGTGHLADAVSGLGRTVSKDNSLLSKISSMFEFDGYNTSIPTFMMACIFGIIGPRLKNAREENEFKEVLCRDVTTVGTVMFAAKALQNMFSELCTKVSGFALNKKNFEGKGAIAKAFDFLRPVKGVHVLNSSELASHYTNIHNYQDGVIGFMKFVDEQGGNIRKMFSSNEDAEKLLKSLYNLSGNETEYAKATNNDIIRSLTDTKNHNEYKTTLNKLSDFFKDTDKNTFLKKAKFMNSSFNFATLFMVVPVLLGWAIPRLNESLTKKREFEKHRLATEGTQTPVSSTIPTANTLPLIGDDNRIAKTFQHFVSKN